MKKSLILLGAAIALAAACTKEEELPFVVEEGKELATIIADLSDSRTTVATDGGSAIYSWQASEKIAVVEEDGEAPSDFVLKDAATGTFIGQKTQGKGLSFAVSPAAALTAVNTLTLPDLYEEYVPGTTNAVMIGTPAGEENGAYRFAFRHAAALVKVSYANVPLGTAYLSFTTDKNINGTWEDLSQLEGVELGIPQKGGKTTYLELKEPVSFPNQTLDFYIPVPVGEYASFSISLLDANMDAIDGTSRAKNATTVLKRGDLFVTPVITLPETSLAGSYIIVSKAATKGEWVAMRAAVDANGRWAYTESGIAYDQSVNLFDSSIDFAQFSNIDYRFEVEELEVGGYVLRNAASGNYVQFIGSASNKGKEVSPEDKKAYDVFRINADGTWTIGDYLNDTDFYTLQYNTGNFFTFYKSNQQPVYLIPYVGAAAPVQLSGTCRNNVVTLTAIPAEAEIRYTLDGSEPDAQSTLYEEPFAITEDVTVKAIALAPDSSYADSDVFELECSYVDPSTTAYYVKVTEGPVTDGQYLIVYEGGQNPVAFDGSLETLDAARNTIEVEISDNGIIRTAETSASEFTINTTTGTLCSASGHYIGVSSNSNGLKQTDEASTYTHNFSIDESGNAVIAAVFSGSTMTLRYNKASDNLRFRYYKSGQQPVALYKLEDNHEPLATPTGLSVEDMTLSWNAVTDAESYNVTIGTTVASVEETSYTFEGEPGYYNVSVVAVPADGSDYGVSAPAVLENAKFGTPVLPAPELSAGICTESSVQVTWTADERATGGYVAALHNADGEKLAEQDELENSVTFEKLEANTEYIVSVYACEVDGYGRSMEVSIYISTTQGGGATIADAIAACPAQNYALTGVTVVGVASTSNALIGDGTGFMLVYKSSHGLAVGDVIDISGTTKRYNGVAEFEQPTIAKTGSAPSVDFGDPVSPTAEMMQAWAAGDFDITYISASGTQSGRKVKLTNGYELYLHKANAATDGKGVSVSGLVYGWSANNSNFNFFFTSIEEDATAPSLEVTPLSKTWAYNDTTPAEFTVTAANGSWDYEPKTLAWVTIERTNTGLKVRPKGENTDQFAYEGIITVALTPAGASYSPIYKEIALTQNKSNGGISVPDPETITFANLGLVNGTQYSTPFDGGNFTITFGGGGNDGKYYDAGTGIRTYGGGTITIASEYTIAKIEFTWDGSYAPGADVANPSGYSTEPKAWTGSANSIVLTRPSGSGHWRLKSVKVTYED